MKSAQTTYMCAYVWVYGKRSRCLPGFDNVAPQSSENVILYILLGFIYAYNIPYSICVKTYRWLPRSFFVLRSQRELLAMSSHLLYGRTCHIETDTHVWTPTLSLQRNVLCATRWATMANPWPYEAGVCVCGWCVVGADSYCQREEWTRNRMAYANLSD